MAKVKSKYECSDTTLIHPIVIDSTALAVLTAPAGAVTSGISAQVSKGNSEHGLRPRGVNLSRLVGTAPNQFKKYKFLPVLTEAEYADTTFAIGATVTIASVAWTVDSKVPEDVN